MVKKFFCIGILVTIIFSLAACNQEENLADYKAAKSAELQAYVDAKGENNYSIEAWQAICKAVTDGRQAVEDATTKPQVDTAITTAKEEINKVRKEVIGMFYSLQEAYDDGLLMVDDLQSIANYQNTGTLCATELSADAISAIKETYLEHLFSQTHSDGTLMFPDATKSDITILGHYGTYNEAIALKICDKYSSYTDEEKEIIVAGISIIYSGAPIDIWQAKQK